MAENRDDNDDDNGWPAAIPFSAEQGDRFTEQQQHHRGLWVQWLRVLRDGAGAAVLWLIWYVLISLAPPPSGVDDQTTHRIQLSYIRIEAPMALATLAVIATLTVAVSVAVRGLADPDSEKSQGIEEARRQFLTLIAHLLGSVGMAVATLAVVWNADSDAFGVPAAIGFLLIAATTAAIASDAMTVLGAAKSTTPVFARWLRERQVDRLRRFAKRAQQELAKVDRRDWGSVVARAAMIVVAVGVLLAIGLLAAFPSELIHDFWSIPDRLWRSALGSLIVGGGVLLFGTRLTLHWLVREWWSVVTWIVLSALFAFALVVATTGVMADASTPAGQVLPPTLIGGTAIAALFTLALNFGPARWDRRRRVSFLIPDLRRLRGGEVWRRVDKLRRANLRATTDDVS